MFAMLLSDFYSRDKSNMSYDSYVQWLICTYSLTCHALASFIWYKNELFDTEVKDEDRNAENIHKLDETYYLDTPLYIETVGKISLTFYTHTRTHAHTHTHTHIYIYAYSYRLHYTIAAHDFRPCSQYFGWTRYWFSSSILFHVNRECSLYK